VETPPRHVGLPSAADRTTPSRGLERAGGGFFTPDDHRQWLGLQVGRAEEVRDFAWHVEDDRQLWSWGTLADGGVRGQVGDGGTDGAAAARVCTMNFTVDSSSPVRGWRAVRSIAESAPSREASALRVTCP
jgi:hypothetical protein